jgi:hypothetical protein
VEGWGWVLVHGKRLVSVVHVLTVCKICVGRIEACGTSARAGCGFAEDFPQAQMDKLGLGYRQVCGRFDGGDVLMCCVVLLIKSWMCEVRKSEARSRTAHTSEGISKSIQYKSTVKSQILFS